MGAQQASRWVISTDTTRRGIINITTTMRSAVVGRMSTGHWGNNREFCLAWYAHGRPLVRLTNERV